METLAFVGLWICLGVAGIFFILLILSTSVQALWMVPFIPTPRPIIDAMIRLAELKPQDTVLELGAGDGRVLFAAEKAEQSIRGIGYEGAIGVWLLAVVRIWLRGSKVHVHCKDFMHIDLSQADVIFTYLSIASMKRLKPKFERELREGTRIITHAFSLPDLLPDRKEFVKMPMGGSNVIRYVWKKPSITT